MVSSRAAIDAACPCAGAQSPAAYRHCATRVLRELRSAGDLPRECFFSAKNYAVVSTCGRPSGTLCCRVSYVFPNLTHHTIERDAGHCINDDVYLACPSNWTNAVDGCDDIRGCVEPVCGNGIVEETEQCDLPDSRTCDRNCHTMDCYIATESCGNGTIDPGETCEPPGAASCDATCHAAACSPPANGEVQLACGPIHEAHVIPSSGGFELLWSAEFQREATVDLLEIALDAQAAPSGPTRLLSEELGCTSESLGATAVFVGDDLWIGWDSNEIFARRFDRSRSLDSLLQLSKFVLSGSTSAEFERGPVVLARGGSGGPTVGSRYEAVDNLEFDEYTRFRHIGPPDRGGPEDLDFAFRTPELPAELGPQAAASDGEHTLWVWQHDQAQYYTGFPPDGWILHAEQHEVVAAWQDLEGNFLPLLSGGPSGQNSLTTPLTDRLPLTTDWEWESFWHAPSVTAGNGVFLVSWAQGTGDIPAPGVYPPATTLTEIRALRAHYPEGNLDADGGELLATAATKVTGGPVTAWDGSRFLVLWAEAAGETSELRAVALEADGSRVDATPRLIASGVMDGDPSLASMGDGRVLVVFRRADSANVSLRGLVVVP